MKKFFKKNLFTLTLLICSVLSIFATFSATKLIEPNNFATAESVPLSSEVSGDIFYGDYEITNYKLDIVVNENNIFNVTEIIDANFLQPKHGIYRKIPTYTRVLMPDGAYKAITAVISNVKIQQNTNCVTGKEDDYYFLKFGNANETLTGNYTYAFSYDYRIGPDIYENSDYFFFNLVGTEWDTRVNNVEYTITMPKDFDSSKIEFASGNTHNSIYADVEYTVTGNTISGKLNTILNAGEAFTIKIELPDGYFKNASFMNKTLTIVYCIVPILVAIIYFVFAFIFTKNNLVEPITFYPPDNLNSLDLAFLFKGKVNASDVSSLIIFLANKGYISIEERAQTTKKGKTTKSKIIFYKLKDYDGNNKNEKLVMNGLFPTGKSTTTAEEVKTNFYLTTNAVIKNKNKSSEKKKILAKVNNAFLVIGVILAMFLFIWSILIPNIVIKAYSTILACCFVFIFLVTFMTILYKIFDPKPMPIILFILGFLSFVIHSTLEIVFKGLTICSVFFFICIALAILVNFVALKVNKRTEYGAEMLGKIKGFKQFLTLAEKPKLEELVEENPSYFYDILPYTYVLGVSKKWISKFDDIVNSPPSWYIGVSFDNFSLIALTNSINRSMNSASSSHSPSSDGSFSGGGFSGGGFGGGGGGSW